MSPDIENKPSKNEDHLLMGIDGGSLEMSQSKLLQARSVADTDECNDGDVIVNP